MEKVLVPNNACSKTVPLINKTKCDLLNVYFPKIRNENANKNKK